jgi:hypothetical protein
MYFLRLFIIIIVVLSKNVPLLKLNVIKLENVYELEILNVQSDYLVINTKLQSLKLLFKTFLVAFFIFLSSDFRFAWSLNDFKM